MYGIRLRDIWHMVKRRRHLFLLGPLVLGLVSTLFSAFMASPPLYIAACRIQFDGELLVDGPPASAGIDPVDARLAGIRSFAVIGTAAERLGLMSLEVSSDGNPPDTRRVFSLEGLRSKIAVRREPSSFIADIEVTDSDPYLSQRLANTLASVFREVHAEDQAKRAAASLEGIEAQLRDERQKLEASRAAFEEFSRNHRLLSVELQGKALLEQGQNIREQLRTITEDERELKRVLSRLRAFIKKPSASDCNFFTPKATGPYLTLNSTLEKWSSHKNLIGRNEKMTETAHKMAVLLERRLRDIRERMNGLEEETSKNEKETEVLLQQNLKYDHLKKRIKALGKMVGLLERKKRERLIELADASVGVTVVGSAPLPKQSVNAPRPYRAGFYGILAGLCLALVSAFVMRSFGPSLGAIEEVERHLGLRVLGGLPRTNFKGAARPQKGRAVTGDRPGNSGPTNLLVCHYHPDSEIAENFRSIRTRILAKGAGGGTKTIAVTSASPEEGKTLVAVNLALTAAQAGMKTLLVEADLRRPAFPGIFGMEASPGLAEILVGDISWERALKTVTDLVMGKMTPEEVMKPPGLDNLHIIMGGSVPSNPALLLESERLGDFIKEAETSYDLVILDTPPVFAWNDMTILATKGPAALLVHGVGDVSKRLLKRAAARLEEIGCHLLGVVLNGIRPEISPEREKRGAEFFAPRSAYILVALLFLGVGLLWRSGLMEFEWREDSRSVTTAGPPLRTMVAGSVEKAPKILSSDETRAKAMKQEPSKEVTVLPQSVSPSPERAKAEEVLVEKRPVLHPYALYLGSFRNMGRVKKAFSFYHLKGLEPYWARVYLKEKGLWYRLYVGHFEERAAAKQFIRGHDLEDAEVRQTKYANLIGASSDPKDLAGQTPALQRKGYSPYVIGGAGGPYRLYVGAYFTRGGAERQRRDLEEDGIAAQVVER